VKNKPAPNYTVYFGGELFDLKHLAGNALLAETINAVSGGKYRCHLPQDFELRGLNPHVIRDQDLIALLECDLAIFNFDGTELDSGTLVEFMLAKFADIPSVLLRTDLRAAGDQGSAKQDPWNLMASFYPRTEVVRAASLIDYRIHQKETTPAELSLAQRLRQRRASRAADHIARQLAPGIIAALDRVAALPPAMDPALRPDVYTWLAAMPGFKGRPAALRRQLAAILQAKIDRGLL
jgi:nucleoside 2-deoxyribosyltransferase